VHFCGIIQGDVGCHNMLLDNNGVLKIADFAGSSVDGCKYASSVDYEVGSKLPGDYESTVRSDIFALGSAIYEMITRKSPWKELRYPEVQRRFERREFPRDFGELPELGNIVEKCWGNWEDHYDSAAEVLEGLYKLDPVSKPPPCFETAISCPTVEPSRRAVSSIEDSTDYEPQRRNQRKRSREGSIYVTSRRMEKETRKSRGSPRSHRRSERQYKNSAEKRMQETEYYDGPLDYLIQRLQALWHGDFRSVADKRRRHR